MNRRKAIEWYSQINRNRVRQKRFAVFEGILTHTCRAPSEYPDGREGEGDGGHEAAGGGRGEPEEHSDAQGEVGGGGWECKNEMGEQQGRQEEAAVEQMRDMKLKLMNKKDTQC